MQHVAFQPCPKEFLELCGDFLRRHEIEHNLILSLCAQALLQKEKTGACDVRFATLTEEDGVVLAALQVPSRNLVLSRSTGGSPEALAEAFAVQNTDFPGIVGPSDAAASFAEHWARLTGKNYAEYMDQIVYALDRVLLPPQVNGAFRFACPDDVETLTGWVFAFAHDALPKSEHLTMEQAREKVERMTKEGRIGVWEAEGEPVAQAGFFPVGDIARVSMVYTPPEQRGHGYASAIVAHLSRWLLDHGFRRCCLYADARNPVSNSIYRKIGYEFVGRSSHYVLER